MLLLGYSIAMAHCNGQTNQAPPADKTRVSPDTIVGGGCEGCELMYVGMPREILPVHTSSGWTKGKQPLMITGTVFQRDGKTPAAGVIIYYWHTDDQGLYAPTASTPKAAIQHGHLRGWVKSDPQGHYTIRTSRPAHYPDAAIPAHIHLSIREPDVPDAYFADLYFDDDPKYLQHRKKYGKADRAGTELLRVLLQGKVQIAEHHIICGLNIPHYPERRTDTLHSGLNIGEDQPSFTPFHAYGPDKGTRTCPVCKYGRYHGILYFVGDHPDWDEIRKWLTFLDKESVQREKYLKAYFVYGNTQQYHPSTRQAELEKLGNELGLQKIALTYVPSFEDTESEVQLNRMNPVAENTFIIYRHRTIVDKFTGLKPSAENFKRITEILDKTQGNYFDLAEPNHE